MIISLVIMALLSFFTGIQTNKGYWSLFRWEFESLAYMSDLEGSILVRTVILSLLVILSHIGVLSLILLTKYRYFEHLLFFLPLAYMTFFALLMPVAVLLLIPFMLTWAVAIGIVAIKVK